MFPAPLDAPAVARFLQDLPEGDLTFLKEDVERWGKVIKAADISVE